MWMSDEIVVVPHWEVAWWDMDKDCELHGSPTGTPWNPTPNVQKRRIERIYGKQVHKGCEGSLEISENQENCGKFQVRLSCAKCHKEIMAEY